MRVAYSVFLILLFVTVPVESAAAGGTTTSVGEFRSAQDGTIKFGVSRGQGTPRLNGASIACYDEHVVNSVHFFGLSRAELEKLRSLIDSTIAELGK